MAPPDSLLNSAPMTDFILVPSRVPEAVQRLIALPAFARSRRFAYLHDEDLELSTVVAGAFGSFLSEPATSQADADAALALLDELASWDDRDVDGILMVGVIESIDPEPLARLRPMMGKRLQWLVDEVEEFWSSP